MIFTFKKNYKTYKINILKDNEIYIKIWFNVLNFLFYNLIISSNFNNL